LIRIKEGGEIMVKIRLKRIGAKKKPFYRIVVADARSPRDGKFIEQVGTYDPMAEPSIINVDSEKVKKWLGNGAQPTETVKKLLKIAGVAE
jgi:small subunit ribosomal protein S16